MREIVIQQNIFLNKEEIVLVFDIAPPDKQQVAEILGKSLYLTKKKPTRKTVKECKNSC